MRRPIQFIIERRRAFTFFLALVLSVLLIVMGESSKMQFARTVTNTVFATGRFTFSWGIYLLDLWRENKRLRIQNLRLSDQINFHDYAIQENERLRRLLEFKERRIPRTDIVTASIVGHDFDRIVNALICDAGYRDGVRKNMAVVTAEGLVGRVYQVFPNSSGIQIIMDARSRVSAEAGGIKGIVRWEGGGFLRLYGLPLSSLPPTGEKVFTTGLGGMYPEGMFIGTVAAARSEDVEQAGSVNVQPEVDFSLVQEVFILKGTERTDIWGDENGPGYLPRPIIQ